MTLNEYTSKPLTTKADGAAVVVHVPFEDVCTFIADGSDTKVANLLAGLWVSNRSFSKEQILKASACALFPNKGYMRRTTSSSAILLAKAAGCLRELQQHIEERWVSITERGANEVVLGLSDSKDIIEWGPLLPALFEVNKNNDIRTQVIRTVHNIARATDSSEARKLREEFLAQMPGEKQAYFNANNLEFIGALRAGGIPHERGE